MQINSTRRSFIRSMAGLAAFGATGCLSVNAAKPFGGKVRLAAVGVLGKGLTDWVPMIKSGKAELVALCDCDRDTVARAAKSKQFMDIPDALRPDLSKIPFYSDYRSLLGDAGILKIDAMTVSTTDHTHAPIAIGAMKQGIHVYVQKPLVRTLWELDYFKKTAKKYGVITQMGNQGSSLPGFRRGVEILRSGILGDVREVHVWTNRPVWPQGAAAGRITLGKADKIPESLDWNAWLGPAKDRPFKRDIPKDAIDGSLVRIAKSVYHPFNWRGFYDFGCGAFGDMACHTMNLPFRGLELGPVTKAELVMVDDRDGIAFPMKSVVKLTYAERKSMSGETLPPVTLYWYDGNEKPKAEIMPQVTAAFKGKVPKTGCVVIGKKGVLCSTNDYGGDSFIALKGEKKVVNVKNHGAAKMVAKSIPLRTDSVNKVEKGSGAAAVSADGHYIEFLDAIMGEGPKFADVGGSRCFSDIEYSIPQMEGILVGVAAQRVCEVGGALAWNSAKQTFDNAAANDLIRPYIREGFEF